VSPERSLAVKQTAVTFSTGAPVLPVGCSKAGEFGKDLQKAGEKPEHSADKK